LKTLFIILVGFLPILAQAVPDNSVYPNSGTTDARRDENEVVGPVQSPVSEDQKEQREEAKEDEFKEGPYDKKGNYRYTPEIKTEENAP
jgi:hypothetical protein